MFKKLIRWAFEKELHQLVHHIEKAKTVTVECEQLSTTLKDLLSRMDVSVDVHQYDNKYCPSWAVISIQGQKSDYVKFVDLGQSEAMEIQRFLAQFDRRNHIKVDGPYPHFGQFIKETIKYESKR